MTMPARGRALVIAVDSWTDADLALVDGPEIVRALAASPGLRVSPGLVADVGPALVSLLSLRAPESTGVRTESPFLTELTGTPHPWRLDDLGEPTLLGLAAASGVPAAAIRWPATIGARDGLVLPLVEDLAHHGDRWSMALAQASPAMATEHLAPRRASGIRLTAASVDDLATEVAATLARPEDPAEVRLLLVRLSALGAVRRRDGLDTPTARRALPDTIDRLAQILRAFDAGPDDTVLLVPGPPLVAARRMIHPGTVLADQGLVESRGPRVVQWSAIVHPAGPMGILRVRTGDDVSRVRAVEAMSALAHDIGGALLPIEHPPGTPHGWTSSEPVAILVAPEGTVIGPGATNRLAVDADDPYWDGPRAVPDAWAPALVRATGPGVAAEALPSSTGRSRGEDCGTWAGLGHLVARTLGLDPARAAAARQLSRA